MKISEVHELLGKNEEEYPFYFDYSNVSSDCVVYDVDTKEKLEYVVSVNTDKGELVCCSIPPKLTSDDEFSTYKAYYTSIYPIYGGHSVPVMFHCYRKIV